MSSKRRILVVDDDPECIDFAKAVLRPRYTVRGVQSANECRSELALRKPDLILLDVMMTHMCDGLDLTRELKKDESTREIPVIMMTNVREYYDYTTQIESSFFPHDRWLDKPVKPDDLLKAVGDVLGAAAGE